MGSDEDLTIRDLETLTGFSARSIHHYISRGLLPNPEGKGPAARYGREHMLRLKLIQQAESSGFRIDQKLQEALDGLSLAQMQELVAMAEGAASEDIKTFGQWLMTGDWQPEPRRRVQHDLLADRMPALHAMIDDAREMAPTAEPRRPYRRRPATTSKPERWERVRIGGVMELAWRRPSRDPKFRYKVDELLRHAERLFGRDERDQRDRYAGNRIRDRDDD